MFFRKSYVNILADFNVKVQQLRSLADVNRGKALKHANKMEQLATRYNALHEEANAADRVAGKIENLVSPENLPQS